MRNTTANRVTAVTPSHPTRTIVHSESAMEERCEQNNDLILSEMKKYVGSEKITLEVLTRDGRRIAGEVMSITDDSIVIGDEFSQTIVRKDIHNLHTAFCPNSRLII